MEELHVGTGEGGLRGRGDIGLPGMRLVGERDSPQRGCVGLVQHHQSSAELAVRHDVRNGFLAVVGVQEIPFQREREKRCSRQRRDAAGREGQRGLAVRGAGLEKLDVDAAAPRRAAVSERDRGGEPAVVDRRAFRISLVPVLEARRCALPLQSDLDLRQLLGERLGGAHLEARSGHGLRAEGKEGLFGIEAPGVAFERQGRDSRHLHLDAHRADRQTREAVDAESRAGPEQELQDRRLRRIGIAVDRRVVIDHGRVALRQVEREAQEIAAARRRQAIGTEPRLLAGEKRFERGGECRRGHVRACTSEPEARRDLAPPLFHPQHRRGDRQPNLRGRQAGMPEGPPPGLRGRKRCAQTVRGIGHGRKADRATIPMDRTQALDAGGMDHRLPDRRIDQLDAGRVLAGRERVPATESDRRRSLLQLDQHMRPVRHRRPRLETQHPAIEEIQMAPGEAIDRFARNVLQLCEGGEQGELWRHRAVLTPRQKLRLRVVIGEERRPVTGRRLGGTLIEVDERRQPLP